VAKTALAALVQEIRATPATQLLTFSIVSPKSDLGFMLLTPGLHMADAFAKELGLAIGPGILTGIFVAFDDRAQRIHIRGKRICPDARKRG
jgi:hydrogen peroxide-dependent heme synthase